MIDQHQHARRPLGKGQRPLRRAERDAKRRVLAFVKASGLSVSDAAGRIGVTHQTLCDRRRRRESGAPQMPARGRPRRPPEPLVQVRVQELLAGHGRMLGLPTLKGLFPAVPRSTLGELRDEHFAGQTVSPQRLTWTTAGAVWSADFTRPPSAIDGMYRHLLVLRDLASHLMLLALPSSRQTSELVAGALRHLFAAHGPPLVLKTDNGSPFIAQGLSQLLAAGCVTPLLSPPLTPRYNGGIEAAAGSIKTRALHIAAGHDRPESWTCDDVESARLAANALARPWGPRGPVPDECWARRPPITAEQRRAFLQRLVTVRLDEEQRFGTEKQRRGPRPGLPLNALERATVARRAIRRALEELGYLLARRTVIMST